ncbi:MAG: DUF1254 domain-containing protein [Alphaproteobacteria bacterium]
MTLLKAMIGGLLLGGVVHIVIVLLVPLYADKDAWARIQAFDAELRFSAVPQAGPGDEALPLLDPRMAHAVCQFDLAAGAIKITAAMPDTFWSIAIFDRRGRNVYSLNDAATDGPTLDLVLTTPVQMAQIRQNPPELLETAIIFERAMGLGFAVLRVLVQDDSLADTVREALARARCEQGL